MPDPKLSVFLCHSSLDKPPIRELYKRLAAEDWIDPWLDEEKLYPGQDWNFEIERAVVLADAVIVCLSQNSVTREGYIHRELNMALDVALEKPEGAVYNIPLRLEDCILPRSLRRYQCVNYYGENRDGAYNSLLRALKRKWDEKLDKIGQESVSQSAQAQPESENLSALTRMLEELQATVSRLKTENEDLNEALKRERLESDRQSQIPARGSASPAQLEKELKQTLEEVARLQNRLAIATLRLKEAEKGEASGPSAEQAEKLSSVAQELHQPLSSIAGYTDLLLGESVGILGTLQRKFIERIQASGNRVSTLIDELYQIMGLATGADERKPEPLDLNMIVENAVSYTSSQVHEKKISLHLDLPERIPLVMGNREALQQIMIHLLQNACAASPPEGNVDLRVQMKTEEGREYILIQVTDTGGGIPPEDMSRVFTRLYRADNILIRGVGDTGVGLSIAKTLTDAQKGRIWVDSQLGVGSTFSVLLPIVRL